MRLKTSVFMGVIFLVVSVQSVPAETHLTNCSNLDTANEVYLLDNDILDSPNLTCMDFTAENITLDCQGYIIDSWSTGATYGIFANGTSGHTIRNCTLVDWRYCIYLEDSSDNTVANNTINETSSMKVSRGIYIQDSTDNEVENNLMRKGSPTPYKITIGIELVYTNSSNLTDNTIESDSEGILMRNSSSNKLTGNNLSLTDGLKLEDSDENNITDNTIVNTSSSGGSSALYLSSSHDNLVEGNNISFNEVTGVRVYFSSNNTVTNNTLESNQKEGIDVYGDPSIGYSSNNSISYNTITDSGQQGIDVYSYCSNNTFYNNAITSNNWTGISCYGDDNNFTENTVTLNGYGGDDAARVHGIYLYNADNNIINGNNACNNNDSDIILSGTSNGNLGDNTCDQLQADGDNVTCSSCLCGNTVTTNTTLTGDHNCTGEGLTIGADNVTFDCNGSTLTGNGSDDGISVNEKSGTTIKNCVITGFGHGISLVDSSNNTLTNNTANLNNESGIQLLRGSHNNTLTDNKANNNDKGIGIDNSSNNNLRGNTANNSRNGITIDYSHGNILIDNTANNNSDNGITLWYSTNNTLINNTANNNGGGLVLDDSTNNTLTNNIANDNNNGIYLLFSSNNNTLINNTANNNQEHGLYVSNSSATGNTLNSNTFCSNNQSAEGYYDIYDADSTTGDNNTCNTAYSYNDTTNGTPCTNPCPTGTTHTTNMITGWNLISLPLISSIA